MYNMGYRHKIAYRVFLVAPPGAMREGVIVSFTTIRFAQEKWQMD